MIPAQRNKINSHSSWRSNLSSTDIDTFISDWIYTMTTIQLTTQPLLTPLPSLSPLTPSAPTPISHTDIINQRHNSTYRSVILLWRGSSERANVSVLPPDYVKCLPPVPVYVKTEMSTSQAWSVNPNSHRRGEGGGGSVNSACPGNKYWIFRHLRHFLHKTCLPVKQINNFSSEEVPKMSDDSIFAHGNEFVDIIYASLNISDAGGDRWSRRGRWRWERWWGEWGE